MNNVFNKKYILISLAIHLGILLIMAYVIHSNKISKTFLVFGAHSKNPTQAIMKFGKRPYVPFLGGKGGNGAKSTAKKTKPKNEFKSISKAKRSLAQRDKKTVNKKLLVKNQKKEKSIYEKRPKLVAAAAGVSVQKKLLVKKMKAEKLKKLKELEAKQAAIERRDEQERRERELLLAQREQALKLKELELQQKEKKRADAKLLLAKKKEEAKKEIVEPDEVPSDSEDNNIDGGGDKIFAENNQEAMILNFSEESDREIGVEEGIIKKEFSRLWSPPFSVPKGTTCGIKLTIGQAGNVERFEFVSRSKMLIYDLSFLRIVKQLNFEGCVRGKEYSVLLCQ